MLDQVLARAQHASSSFETIKMVADVRSIIGAANERGGVILQNTPAGFLFFGGQGALRKESGSRVFKQTVTDRFGFLIVTRQVNDPTGEEAVIESYNLVSELDSRLLGWTPDGASDQMEKAGNAGQLVQWVGDFHFFQATYQVQRRICITGE